MTPQIRCIFGYHHQMVTPLCNILTAAAAFVGFQSRFRLNRSHAQPPRKAHNTNPAVTAIATTTMTRSAARRVCLRKGLKPISGMLSRFFDVLSIFVPPPWHVGIMFASTNSVALVGVEARAVRVEAHVGGGEKGRLNVVGLPDTAVREAKDRVMAAMSVAGYRFPPKSVTVNLAPADLPKSGSAYDLPIAIALLAAAGEIPQAACRAVALGELALDGTIRPAHGGLGAAIVSSEMDLPCLLPPGAAEEAVIVPSASVRMVDSLPAAIAAALDEGDFRPPLPVEPPPEPIFDLSEVRGQPLAKRALEIAAAGGHHMFMTGSPGSGKTMLARCLPGILPALEEKSALEVAQVWACVGRPRPWLFRPPIRNPHHTASMAALIGGGSRLPVPGEISMAHHGVLFLDELGEFSPSLLDGLRQPLEEGQVTIARKGVSITYPTEIQLLAATNPCPCGFQRDHLVSCTCSDKMVQRYKRRLSGPLMDRFDIRIKVNRADPDAMVGPPEEPSIEVAKRVAAARELQELRGVRNRDLGRTQLDSLDIASGAQRLIEGALRNGGLTGRGFDRIRRLARTIADLDNSLSVSEDHASEALGLRGLA